MLNLRRLENFLVSNSIVNFFFFGIVIYIGDLMWLIA